MYEVQQEVRTNYVCSDEDFVDYIYGNNGEKFKKINFKNLQMDLANKCNMPSHFFNPLSEYDVQMLNIHIENNLDKIKLDNFKFIKQRHAWTLKDFIKELKNYEMKNKAKIIF